MHYTITSILFLFSVLGIVNSVDFTRCDSPGGEVLSLSIEGCVNDEADKCSIFPGSLVSISVSIKALIPFESAYAQALLTDTVKGTKIPFIYPVGNICHLGIRCPVQAGDIIQYSEQYKINNGYVFSMLNLGKFQVLVRDSKDDTVIACVELQISFNSSN
ncbi:epididymal secretory protein E1-like [Centruroides sculpturatus]|uniref:epididymal secretory protein E1-like n=1 Tax=Centruroides sculpturatus TaxID=218467 RepID=UPI000C6E8F0C|nr:epididymal secretory protein E1-like [Centruroides sculpturatus]